MSDVIDTIAGVALAERAARPEAVANAQASFEALLGSSLIDAPLLAAFVAGISGDSRAYAFYRDLARDRGALGGGVGADTEAALEELDAAVRKGVSAGPYAGGDFVTFGRADFDFAHLLTFHPKDASPAAIGHLQAAGFSDDAIVALAQLVSFLSFQLRVAHGVRVLAGEDAGVDAAQSATPARAPGAGSTSGTSDPGWVPGERTLIPDVVPPAKFVNHPLGWKPWVKPLAKDELTDVHLDALVKPERVDWEYFRLLARDPASLKARTLTDLDIFYNTDGGLGRAERELAATVTSRLNGCEFCASVHQANSKKEGGDAAAIDRLLDEGVAADLGSEQWNAIRDAAVALTATPFGLGRGHVEKLEGSGLNRTAVLDVINAAAFFNWANRLMLTLGQPDVPKRYR